MMPEGLKSFSHPLRRTEGWLKVHRSRSPNSRHRVMMMLVALLFAVTAQTFAVDTNMNVTGKQTVQELMQGNMGIGRNYSVTSNTSLRGTEKSAVGGNVPVVGRVATILWNDYSITTIKGWAQCIGAVKGYLNYYEHCMPTCAKVVARKIAKFACKSYCSCT